MRINHQKATDIQKMITETLKEENQITEFIRAYRSKEEIKLGDRMADKIANFGGSWTFVISFTVIMTLWLIVNGILLTKPFDPQPFTLLNLVLSTMAAIQAPVILMSQNRQSTKDRLRAEDDYAINLKSEIELRELHKKVDRLIKKLVDVEK